MSCECRDNIAVHSCPSNYLRSENTHKRRSSIMGAASAHYHETKPPIKEGSICRHSSQHRQYLHILYIGTTNTDITQISNKMIAPSAQALLLVVAVSASFANAFVPPLASSAIRQSLVVHQHATTTASRNSRSRYTRLYQKSEDEEEDDDDEDDVLLEDDEDWRNFRAKLVMGETSTPSSAKSSSQSDEGDLDGIGSLFQEEFIVETEVKPVTAKDMTPLDPSQWAYDSGNVIEQGAVILGG